MHIIISKKTGFCQGVKRALDLAINEATKSEEPVYTFGPLVHNSQVISYLEDLGIESIDRVDDVPAGSHIIIRSHGIGPNDLREITSHNFEIIDGTCGKVITVQTFAKDLDEKGYSLIILGEPEHPEVRAIREYVNDKALVLSSLDEIVEPLYEQIPEKIGLVCQTTLSLEFFNAAVKKIRMQIPHIEVHNTICGATRRRQQEAREVAKLVDLMFVIGSPVSSNTSKLAELCGEITMVKRIETQDDLDENWFESRMKIGVTAGASTPDWIIMRVIKKLMEISRSIDGDVEIENAANYITSAD